MRSMLVAALALLATAPALAAPDARCAALTKAFGEGMPQSVTASGLRYHVLKPGRKRLADGNVAITEYLVCFPNGTFLDASAKGQTLAFTVGAKQVIAGTEEATRLIGTGGEIVAYLPSNLGYGVKGSPPAVPPNADLIFDVRLVSTENVALSTLLNNAYLAGGITAMQTAYTNAAALGFKGMYAREDDLNAMGYHLLKKHLTDAAVAVLGFNAERFPDSWNAYDSLGDAYKAAGDTPLASKNYRRALELNPKDQNAASYLAAPPTPTSPGDGMRS